MQIIIGFIIIVVAFVGIIYLMSKRQPYEVENIDEFINVDFLVQKVQLEITKRLSVRTKTVLLESIISGKKDLQVEAAETIKMELNTNLEKSRLGFPESIEYVKRVVKSIIQLYITEENVKNIIPNDLNTETCLRMDNEILLVILHYYITRKLKKPFCRFLDNEYKWFTPREIVPCWDNSRIENRCMVDDDMFYETIQGVVDMTKLTFNDKLNIVTQLVYQRWRGYSTIDCLLTIDMDELDCGCSGYLTENDNKYTGEYPDIKSAWIMYHGQNTHLKFLSFGSHDNLKKIVLQLSEKEDTPALTKSNATKVLEDAKGARVTLLRPPNGESFAVFYRKPSLSVYTKAELLCHYSDDGEVIAKNWELPSQLIYYLMQGEITNVFTGQQGTGKTSLMKACIGDTRPMNTRVLELAAELHLRQQYSDRNIMSLVPSQYRSMTQLQDILKKTNGGISMIGEIAEDRDLAVAIAFALTASVFTMWSAHQIDNKALIADAAKAYMSYTGMSNYNDAVDYVLQVISSNIHMGFWESRDNGFNFGKQRVIEFISQIEPAEQVPFPEVKEEDTTSVAIGKSNLTHEEYYRRTTEIRFKDRDIIRFNKEKGMYEAKDWYTPKQEKRIYDHLSPEDKISFIKFRDTYWNGR